MNVSKFIDDVMVYVEDGRLYITADKEHLGDFCETIEGLFKLSRILRMKAVTARGEMEAIEARKTEQEKAREMEQYRAEQKGAVEKEAMEVYRIYLAHLNNGCAGNETRARDATARDLEMSCRDVKRNLRVYHESAAAHRAGRRMACANR